MKVLFLFIDGVGLGTRDPDTNPFTAAATPALDSLLEGTRPFDDEAPFHGDRASLIGVDATLGAPGVPQSGTGHATLLTGLDGVQRFGRHYGPWVPTALRAVVAERSILAVARRAGRRVAFANAYPEELVARADVSRPAAEWVAGRRLGPLRSGPPLAALGAGVLTRHTPELERGDAIASEITNAGWIHHLGRDTVPEITAADAGRNLARIAAAHDLTLFAHYTTDYVGHRGTFAEAVEAVERVDAFLGAVVARLPEDALLLLVSDHGNLEDMGREHTRNPALCIVAGPGHERFARRLHDLRDVAPAVLGVLGV